MEKKVLQDCLTQEFNSFKEELLLKPTEEALLFAYEFVCKQTIADGFAEDFESKLSESEMERLESWSREGCLLDNLYQLWMNSAVDVDIIPEIIEMMHDCRRIYESYLY